MKTNENRRKTTELEQCSMQYLNMLRESGQVNMFGATPHLAKEMEISQSEARKIMSLWISNFNDTSNYETVKIKTNLK